MKETIDKQDFIKTKNFCSAKDTVKSIRQATDWEKNICKRHMIKDCYPEYTKNP